MHGLTPTKSSSTVRTENKQIEFIQREDGLQEAINVAQTYKAKFEKKHSDLYLYIESIHRVSNSHELDLSLKKKIEKFRIKTWTNDNTSCVDFLLNNYHETCLNLDFSNLLKCYCIDRAFAHHLRSGIRSLLTEMCRPFVEADRIIKMADEQGLKMDTELLAEARRTHLSDYTLRCMIYCEIACFVQPNCTLISPPAFNHNSGQQLKKYWLDIHSFSTGCNRFNLLA